MKKIGFIGCGNMGSAIVGGMLLSKNYSKENIYCSTKSKESAEKISKTLGINIASNIEVAKVSDYLFLAVKPHFFSEVISQIREYVKKDVVIISIAAGIEISDMEECFAIEGLKVVRTMPNTPALVGEGMTAICSNANVLQDELDDIKKIFDSFGKSEELEEKYFHSFIALSGSSPAYVYMFIEAMGMAGIKSGIQAQKAYRLAAQSVLGSAKMVLETGEHPAILRDKVCSPGGTTIAAVTSLEKFGLTSAVINAMEECENKSKELSKK